MFFDEEKLEKAIKKELEEYKDWIVEIPTTQEEFKRRFSLKNDEISIDKVDFENVKFEDVSALIVELPKTQEEFDRRFII